jgi:hypothetical protein
MTPAPSPDEQMAAQLEKAAVCVYFSDGNALPIARTNASLERQTCLDAAARLRTLAREQAETRTAQAQAERAHAAEYGLRRECESKLERIISLIYRYEGFGGQVPVTEIRKALQP